MSDESPASPDLASFDLALSFAPAWVKEATTQGGPPNSNDYGYLWWLNTKAGKSDLPRSSYSAVS